MVKALEEKNEQIKVIGDESNELKVKLSELQEKEKKFYYQNMIFEQELNERGNKGISLNKHLYFRKHNAFINLESLLILSFRKLFTYLRSYINLEQHQAALCKL